MIDGSIKAPYLAIMKACSTTYTPHTEPFATVITR